MNMNMEIDTLRGWSNIPSTNSFRKFLVHSSALSVLYIRMKTLNNCYSWTEQIEDNTS